MVSEIRLNRRKKQMEIAVAFNLTKKAKKLEEQILKPTFIFVIQSINQTSSTNQTVCIELSIREDDYEVLFQRMDKRIADRFQSE